MRAMAIPFFVAIAALLIFSVPTTSRSQGVSKRSLDSQQLERMSARIKSLVDEGAMVGAVTLVERHGEMFSLQAVGFQELESRKPMRADTINHTLNIRNAITQRPAYQGLGWGLSGDPMIDFPLTSACSYGHNGAFGSMIWIDPKEGLIRIFLEHLFGARNEVDMFMSMAGAAVVN